MIRRRRILLGLAFGAIAAGSSLGWILSDAPARWLIIEDPPAVVDALVVFAGDPDYERTTTAAHIFLSGRARLLILTGGEPGPGDSSGSLKSQALNLGVPYDHILTEDDSHSTREAVMAVKPLLVHLRVRHVGLVTSPYHQRRAYLTASRAWSDIKIYNWPAHPSWWSADQWFWQDNKRRPVISEYLKILYYILRGWIC